MPKVIQNNNQTLSNNVSNSTNDINNQSSNYSSSINSSSLANVSNPVSSSHSVLSSVCTRLSSVFFLASITSLLSSFILVLRHGLKKIKEFLGLFPYLRTLFPWRSSTFIKRNRQIRIVAFISCFAFILLSFTILHPLSSPTQPTEAATGSSQSSSLTLDLASSSASVDLLVTDPEGSFAVSSSNAEFNVTTNNFTGYTLSIMSSNDEGLLTSTNGNSLSSITSAISLDTFAGSSSYNGKWGYRPSVYNAVANTSFLPSPTTTATTLDTTTAPNTSTPNYYTIEIGVRSDYTTASSSYTNTFIITAVSNPINYTISYNSNTSDNVTNMPATQSSSTSATSIVLADNVPTRAHYTFTGWCSTIPTTSSGVDSCSGDNAITFLPGANYGIDQTTLNNTTLYAMWKIDSFTQTTQVRYENADGTWGDYSTVDTKALEYGDSYAWDTSSISDFDTAKYQPASVASYTVTGNKTNQVSIYRATYDLTVTENSSYLSDPTGSGTYRWGETVTIGVTKMPDEACYSYSTPTWTKSSGATGSLNSTSGTSVTYTMGTTNDTVTATATRTSVDAIITFNMGTGVTSILFGGKSYTNGQTASVTCGTKKDIVGVYSGNYWFSSWSATAGTFNDTSYFHARYTVDGPATITLSSRTLTNRGSMQNFTASQCRSYASSDPVLVTDSRDNNTYAVRYINGNCWMTQNLRLSGGRTLTSADSNVASSWYFPNTSLTNGNSYTEAYSTISSNTSYGGYYNFCAASAGTNCQSYTKYNTTYDICPKGWRLPTSSEQSGITGTSYVSAFSPVYSGRYSYGSLIHTGSLSYWWSSTADATNTQYYLSYNGSNLKTNDDFNYNGFSVRCVRSS